MKIGNAFEIAFDRRDKKDVLDMWSELLSNNRWSEGEYLQRFEQEWSEWNALRSVAVTSWWGGAIGVMDYIDVKSCPVLCPANTYIATPKSITAMGGVPIFYDCRRDDLCGSFESFKEKAEKYKPKAAWLVHIGGHLSFDSLRIAEYCKENNITLVEDCAHAHGAEWNGIKPGSIGDAGVFSLYATKTITTGEGGVVVSRHPELIEHVQKYRNYGKPRSSSHNGGNFRMDEFRAALGLVQLRRLPDILQAKQDYAKNHLDPKFNNRVELPEGMSSGYYKYIVFEEISNSTGKVYESPCYKAFDSTLHMPNTDWVSKNHWCVSIYYSSH